MPNKGRGGELLVSTEEDMLSKDGQLLMHWSQQGLGKFAVLCRTKHTYQLRFSVCFGVPVVLQSSQYAMWQSRLYWLGHTTVYKYCCANFGGD